MTGFKPLGTDQASGTITLEGEKKPKLLKRVSCRKSKCENKTTDFCHGCNNAVCGACSIRIFFNYANKFQ